MASPQAEHGHIDIANETAEQLMRLNLSSYEWRTLWALWRKTYGWHKKDDKISITQFQKLTGLKRRHQHRALLSLQRRHIVTCIGNSFVKKYGFQKDYSKWKLPTVTNRGNSRTVTNRGNTSLPIEVTKPLPIEVPTNKKKETIQKKGVHTLLRDFFYKRYQEKFGAKYLANFQKDTRILADIFKVVGSEDKVYSLIDKFFESDDPFVKKSGYTTGIFLTQVNRLQAQGGMQDKGRFDYNV